MLEVFLLITPLRSSCIDALIGLGTKGASSGLAGRFNGQVQFSGTFAKGSGSFKIEPLLEVSYPLHRHSEMCGPATA